MDRCNQKETEEKYDKPHAVAKMVPNQHRPHPKGMTALFLHYVRDMKSAACTAPLALLLTASFLLTVPAHAQQMNWVLVDEARGGREIPIDLRFDASMQVARPLVVIGHGFAMTSGDYDDLSAAIVGAGFNVALVDTESGLAPSHEDFGLDLAFVATHAAQEVGGDLGGLISGNSALVGHSMGGGAAWLGAAEMGGNLGAVVGWAPAETNPSALAAAASIEAPALVISGTADAITPQATQHLPLFDALDPDICRAFASLEEGGHCGFADSGTLCDFGEFGFSGMPRATQQFHTAALTIAWLQHHLLADPTAWMAFENHGETEAAVNLDIACSNLSLTGEMAIQRATCHPNPVRETLFLEVPANTDAITIRSSDGRIMHHWHPQQPPHIDVATWPPGVYFLALEGTGQAGHKLCQALRFIKTP